MTTKDDDREWELPRLRESHQMPGVGGDFWSVKFYPYTEPGVDPVFAVVGGKRILVCRPPTGKETSSKVEIIRLIIDEESDPLTDSGGSNHFACAWSKDRETGDPLLCVAGSTAKIKVINVITGECLRVLAGHGGEINDLAVSPTDPYILATGSDDCTVRIWSLDPAHEAQPCCAILEGEGHKETILSVSFHKSGRYLLSGGVDHIINMWTLPELPDINTGTNRTTRIFYPHFSTSEIHTNIIDCVAWHNDLILSKAARDHSIVLWSIANFDSTLPPPLPSAAPIHDPSKDTRSAFHSSTTPTALYTRHLQFSIPDSDIIFMRFSLFPGYTAAPNPSTKSSVPSSNPVLAFCNENSKVFFWDLARLENYHDTVSACSPEPFVPSSKHPFLQPFRRRNRGGGAIGRITRERTPSPTESSSSQVTGTGTGTGTGSDGHESSQEGRGREREKEKDKESSQEGRGREKDKEKESKEGKGKIDWEKSRAGWVGRYDAGDPLRELQAHHTEVVRGLAFTGRQVAWSGDGRWCVVVGSGGVIACFQRWKD